MRHPLRLVTLLAALWFGFVPAAGATPIPLGILAFDMFVSGPGGTNGFFVSNLTGNPASGGFALPPDFPVVTAISFLFPSLTWPGRVGVPYAFGGASIGSGNLDPAAALQFPDSAHLASASFTAVLSTKIFRLGDGRLFEALSNILTATLTNPAGALAPGDFGLLSVDAAEVPPVPETPLVLLVMTGLGAFGVWRLRRASHQPQA